MSKLTGQLNLLGLLLINLLLLVAFTSNSPNMSCPARYACCSAWP